ncbi:unnamed protein product [Alopecurus aequalis]
MAVAMVSLSTGAMNSVLAKLNTLLQEVQQKLVKGGVEFLLVKGDLEKGQLVVILLKDELVGMKGLLEKMAKKEDLDPLAKGWMKQVREMTYDFEDNIDDFVNNLTDPGGAGRSRVKRIVHKTSRPFKEARLHHHFVVMLQDLKIRVLEASERRSRYNIDDAVVNTVKAGTTSSSMLPDLKPIKRRLPLRLVGMEEPSEQLIELLAADDHQQMKVVSVVGPAGFGKSTLAMEVYASIKHGFDFHGVIEMTRDHDDLSTALRSILPQSLLSAAEQASTDITRLIDKLRRFLGTKRYLIIIQNIWDSSAWNIIRLALPTNNGGSRIIVTTRISDVAKSCCYSKEDRVFHMRPLSFEGSKELLLERTFGSRYSCPLDMENILNKVLKRCGGIPLAINIIAGTLATKSVDAIEEWMSTWDSIGKECGAREVLVFCYADLPIHLRTCLLYLSIFPDNHVIYRAELIRRWIAEGLVAAQGMSSEKAGESYFNELINKGFIQPVGIQYNGQIEACRVHELILDFVRYKSSEENFVTIHDKYNPSSELRDMVRRLSLHSGHGREVNLIRLTANYSHVRSLTVFKSDKETLDLATFRALRVLDIESSGDLQEYLQNIETLYMLKYLRLETTRYIELSEQIERLKFLQTLDLTRALIRRLPSSIVRLKQLKYLLVNNLQLPNGIGELQALQELSHIAVDSSNPASSLEELGSLTMLRVLGLNWRIRDRDTGRKQCVESLVSSLGKLGTSNLQFLHIESDSACSLEFLPDALSASYSIKEFRMTSVYYFPGSPKWMASLVSITFLEINIDIVGEEVLHILGTLTSLLVLLLSVRKSTGPEQGLIIRSRSGLFQCLKEFNFICHNNFDMVMFEPETMPMLEKLQFGFLDAQESCVHADFHYGIEHLASLKHLCVGIDSMGLETVKLVAVEDAIRSAVNSYPNCPKLELQRRMEEDKVEIHVGDEEEEGHNNEGSSSVKKEKTNT